MEEIYLSQNELYDPPLRRAYIVRSVVFLVFFLAVLFIFESISLLQSKEKKLQEFYAELKAQTIHLSFSLFEISESINSLEMIFLKPPKKSFQDFFPLFLPLPLVSTNKYYAPIDVLPEKVKEGKGKGLLHLEMVNQNLSSDDAFVTTQLMERMPKKMSLLFRLFPFINSISYISRNVHFFFPWLYFPPRVDPFWIQQSHDLEFSILELSSNTGWRSLSFQGETNNWSLSYVTPHFLDKKLYGFFAITLKPEYFEKNLKNFPIPFGSLVMVDDRSKKIFHKDKNGFDSHAIFLEDYLPVDLSQNDIFYASSEALVYHKITWLRGIWTCVLPFEKAPFKFVFICDSWDFFRQQIGSLFLSLLWQAFVVSSILFANYILIQRFLTRPLSQLMAHVNQERLGLRTNIEKFSSTWKVWAFLISSAFQEKRRRINDLEFSLQERSLELRRTIERLQKSQKQIILQEKLSSLGTLVKGIAHELKNPLHFIVNFSMISKELLHQIPTSKSSAATLQLLEANHQKILDYAERANNILNRIILQSRPQNETAEILDLRHLAKEYVMICYQGFFTQKDPIPFMIELDLTSDPLPILCYPQDLGRVFLNILSNGFEAMITRFKEENEPQKAIPRLLISVLKEEGEAVLSFLDNGLGIPSEIQGQIFDPFFSTKGNQGGVGLGLSMSYDIIQRHEGSLKMKTQKNETLFIIRLPLASSEKIQTIQA